MLRRRANGVLNVLILGAALLFAALPGMASSHPDAHAASGPVAASHDISARQSGEEAPEHCHPGLECFIAAVFLLPAEITPPAILISAEYASPFRMVDGVLLTLDLPPPRPGF